MQHLTLHAVAKANIENIDDLGAFTGKSNCLYMYEDFTACGIGIALDRKTLRTILQRNDNGGGVSSLRACGIIAYSEEDRSALQSLQMVHDKGCSIPGTFPAHDSLGTDIVGRYVTANDLSGKPITKDAYLGLMRHIVAVTYKGEGDVIDGGKGEAISAHHFLD